MVHSLKNEFNQYHRHYYKAYLKYGLSLIVRNLRSLETKKEDIDYLKAYLYENVRFQKGSDLAFVIKQIVKLKLTNMFTKNIIGIDEI